MKNLFLAFVFFVGTTMSFATTNLTVVEDDFGTCTVTITETDAQGNTTTYTYVGEADSQEECDAAGAAILALHENGFL